MVAHDPLCRYLHPKPENRRDCKRLRTLRGLGDVYDSWKCSQWRMVMDWYDERSGPVHGDPDVVAEHASEAQYWTVHYLMEPILNWLRLHSVDPVGDLESELNAIADPPGWQAMIAALDSPIPPPQPPPL